jgi:hypothetical protein
VSAIRPTCQCRPPTSVCDPLGINGNTVVDQEGQDERNEPEAAVDYNWVTRSSIAVPVLMFTANFTLLPSFYFSMLKGLYHEMDLAFEDFHGQFLA